MSVSIRLQENEFVLDQELFKWYLTSMHLGENSAKKESLLAFSEDLGPFGWRELAHIAHRSDKESRR
jgi:hypothetical protein